VRIDVHSHVLPAEWPDLAERYGDPRWPRLERADGCSARIMVGERPFRDVDERLFDAGARAAAMERTGVDRQVLSTVPVMFSYWAEPRRTREMARYLNEHLAGVVAAGPGLFDGFGTVPLNDTGLAIEELERCVGELGLAGVEIGTNVGGTELDAPRLVPFFRRAAELGAVVFVHPWQMTRPERLADYYFLYTVGMPAETAYAVGALLFGGVLEAVPDLQVLFAHGGGSVPFTIGRMERGWEVWPAAREHLHEPPREQLRRCHFDSVVWDEASLELLVRRVGAERVLLGSDFPFIMGEDRPGELVERSALSSAEKELILGANAERLLGTVGARS
jgi:aminocarboxymuconate-semialdehyde decarboxylase